MGVCGWLCGVVGCLPVGAFRHRGAQFLSCCLLSGRLTLRRHPVRATARARISQFAEANSTCRWLRFLAIPR